MSVISKEKNVIKIFYNANSTVGKQTLGYVQSSFKDILEVDTAKTKVTGTQWVELADLLGGKVGDLGDLIDKKHPDFENNYDEHSDFGTEDWIKILDKHPSVLTYPIVIIGNNIYQIRNPSDIDKYIDESSTGLDDQNPKKKAPTWSLFLLFQLIVV